MSDAREATRQALRERFGPCADPVDVLDALLGSCPSGEVICRRYAVRHEFEHRFVKEPHSAHRIHEEIADKYGISRQGVANIVLGR